MQNIFKEIEEIGMPNRVEFDAFSLEVVNIFLFGDKKPEPAERQYQIEAWFRKEYRKSLSDECRNILEAERAAMEWERAGEWYDEIQYRKGVA